jgi:hypothetical protein
LAGDGVALKRAMMDHQVKLDAFVAFVAGLVTVGQADRGRGASSSSAGVDLLVRGA